VDGLDVLGRVGNAADQTDLEDLTPRDRAQIEQAVTQVRRSRTVTLGILRVRQPVLDVRPAWTPT
jgi:hypothetical protein